MIMIIIMRQAELDKLRSEREQAKEAAERAGTGRSGGAYIATPGLRAGDAGPTPRRTPARLGL